MNAQPTGRAHPADQILALTAKTLWVLYAAFWLSVIVYAGIALVYANLSGAPAGEGGAGWDGTPTASRPLQILFLAVGVGCLVLVLWIGRAWLRPERLWAGTQSLEGLAAHLAQRRAARRAPLADASAAEEPRQQSLSRAVQHLLGRLIVAHLVPWVIAEVPALLGLFDRFLSGTRSVWPVLLALSALGLLLHRPSRTRLREILDPIYRARETHHPRAPHSTDGPGGLK